MKTVILAGGYGTRISEESDIRPKPMVEIGGKPILWHIMKTYSHYGYNDFVILLGYKAYVIKEYFANYFLHNCDVEIDTAENKISILNNRSEKWKITLIDTGLNTMTGGRLKRAEQYIKDEPFFLTYGDGVSNVNINSLLQFHKNHKGLLTLTSIQPEGRFGVVEIQPDQRVSKFHEKPKGEGAWINGGFFVCDPKILDFIKDDSTVFEKAPLEKIAEKNQLFSYKHEGFWKCLDTLRDKSQLNELWQSGNAPWKVW